MGKIYVLGLGPGDVGSLTLKVVERLNSGDKNYLRTEKHPIIDYIKGKNISYETYDYVYEKKG
jgi:tetrapyrrole methylase family protein/MazG family protein